MAKCNNIENTEQTRFYISFIYLKRFATIYMRILTWSMLNCRKHNGQRDRPVNISISDSLRSDYLDWLCGKFVYTDFKAMMTAPT